MAGWLGMIGWVWLTAADGYRGCGCWDEWVRGDETDAGGIVGIVW